MGKVFVKERIASMEEPKKVNDLQHCLDVEPDPQLVGTTPEGVQRFTIAGITITWDWVMPVLKEIAASAIDNVVVPFLHENIPVIRERIENSNLGRFVKKILLGALDVLEPQPDLFTALAGTPAAA
jgi:hypothetical protein